MLQFIARGPCLHGGHELTDGEHAPDDTPAKPPGSLFRVGPGAICRSQAERGDELVDRVGRLSGLVLVVEVVFPGLSADELTSEVMSHHPQVLSIHGGLLRR